MPNQSSELVSRWMVGLVALGFCFGGAFLIYNEERLRQENKQLSASGIEAVATVTANEIEITGGDPTDEVYAITFTFPDQTGAIWSGQTKPYTNSDTWFETPSSSEKIRDADIAAGDQILVRYLPEDPDVYRTIEDCRNCVELGSFGDRLGTFVGMFLFFFGAAFLYALRRRGVVSSR